jgi:hypothetical protein
MGHGPRRSSRRILLGGLAAITIAAGAALPATAAFAVDDYPVPPPATVSPNNTDREPTAEVESATVTKSSSGTGTEVLGAQVTRGSLPFTGGDIAGIAAIGVGAVAVGAVMVKRGRRNAAGIDA